MHLPPDKDIPIRNINSFDSMESGLIIYNKGPLLLQSVALCTGQEEFDKRIKNMYQLYRCQFFNYSLFTSHISEKEVQLWKHTLSGKGVPFRGE